MATQVQNRRGTTAEHSTFTGAVGEVTIDTDKDTVVVHDGSTAGGNPLMREDGSNSALAPGSAGTPSLKFTGDTNTGIYSPGADQVAISTNGSERFRVNATGQVGIGGSPGTALDVIGAGTASTSIRARNDSTSVYLDANNGYSFLNTFSNHPFLIATNNTERLRITSGGLVGVGTSSPSQLLHLSSSGPRILLTQTSANSNAFLDAATSGVLEFSADDNNVAASSSIRFKVDGGEKARIDDSGRLLVGTSTALTGAISQYAKLINLGNTASPAAGSIICLGIGNSAGTIVSGNNLGRIYFTDNAAGEFASIACQADANAGTGDYPGRLVFSTTADGASSPTERLRIDSSGRVGIGTTSPAAPLTIGSIGYSTTDRASALRLLDVGGTNGNNYGFGLDNTVGGFYRTAGTGGFHAWLTANTERARIDTSGRLLVGTSSARSNYYSSVTPGGLQSETGSLAVFQNSNNTTGSALYVGKSRGTTANSNTVVQADDQLGALVFFGADGTNVWPGAQITASVDGTPGANDMPGRLVFSTTADGASSPTERLRIDSSGRVGVGTTPSTLLHIQSTDPSFRFKRSDAGTDAYGELTTDTSGLVTMKCDPANAAAGSGFRITVDNSEALRVDSSSRLLVGTSSFSGNATQVLQGQSAGSAEHAVLWINRGSSASSGNAIGTIRFADSSANQYAQIDCFADATTGSGDYPGRLVFSVCRDGQASPTEAMRISNTGETGVFTQAGSTVFVARSAATAGTSDRLFAGINSATGNVPGGNISFQVFTNGNVQNTNNSYGAISDAKLKENIVDATSQWADIRAIQVRKYNFKEGQTHTQIGLIAQEVELVSPGLVSESPDCDEDGNDLGTVTKSVNYSVLYMKAVKALQEAMERIETLEAKVAALEAA